MAKEEGTYMLLTQLPVLYLILKKGAGVDAGVGQAYGVLDFWFSKVFSRAFGEEKEEGGKIEWKVGDVVTDSIFEKRSIKVDNQILINLL